MEHKLKLYYECNCMYKILKINKQKLDNLKPETAVQAINQQWRRCMRIAQTNDNESYFQMILTQTINRAHEILFEVHGNNKEEELDMDIIKQQHSCETVSELIRLLERRTEQLESIEAKQTTNPSTSADNTIMEAAWDPNIKTKIADDTNGQSGNRNNEVTDHPKTQTSSELIHIPDYETEQQVNKRSEPTKLANMDNKGAEAIWDPNIKIKTEKTDGSNEEDDNKSNDATNHLKVQSTSELSHIPDCKTEQKVTKQSELTEPTNTDNGITETTWDPNIKIKIEKADEPNEKHDNMNEGTSNPFKSQTRERIKITTTKTQANKITDQTTGLEQPSSSGSSKDTKKELSTMGWVQREPKITDHRIYKNSIRLKTLWPKWNNIHTWETLEKMKNYPKVLKVYLKELKKNHPRRLTTLIKMYRDEDILNQT